MYDSAAMTVRRASTPRAIGWFTSPICASSARRRAARLLPDDQSRAFAAHAARCRLLLEPDARSGPALRAVLQPPPRTQRHVVGRTLPFLPRRFGPLRARLLPLHRDESRARLHGSYSVRLPLVEPPRAHLLHAELDARAACGICGPGAGGVGALRRIPGPFRRGRGP